MNTKTDSVKWFVWVYGAAMVPNAQIIMGDESGPFINEYTKTHLIKKTRIAFEHINLDLTALLSKPIYQFDGGLHDSTAKPQGSKGTASTS